MARPLKLEISESVEELKALLGSQKTAQGKERVQAVYRLKLGQVKTIGELAQWLGRHRVTVQEWLAADRGWRARKFTRFQKARRTTKHDSLMGSGSTAKTLS